MNLNKYFDYAKEIGFSDIEFKVILKKELTIQVFHKKVEKYSIAENETIHIRGIVNNKMVSGYSENKNNIKHILDEMVVNSALIEENKKQEIFAGSSKYNNFKTNSVNLANVSVADKIALCLKAEQEAYNYNNKISDVDEVSYNEIENSMKIINSKGLKLSYKVSYGMLVLSVVAKDNDDIRTGFMYQFGQDINDFIIDKLVKEACDEAINALNGTQCDSKKYKVLMNPDVFASFTSFLVDSIHGDNVNKNKSLLKDKLNEIVASKKFTLIENPHIKKYPYFYRAFDDEGVATYKKTIIDKGILKMFLYNIEEAKVANTVSTGNGYGGSSIGVDSAFLMVKPGKNSKEQLCQKINNGILISSVQGLHAGMNSMSGDFSLQASGYLIENGKITKPVNLITIAGNLFKMYKDIVEVANDSFVTYSGISCPSVYIKSLAVSGK